MSHHIQHTMGYKKIIFYIAIAALLSVLTPGAASAETTGIDYISTLDIFHDTIKKIRYDTRQSIYITKSNRNPQLMPDLQFYKYRVKQEDTFWKILAATSSDIDTLMTVNSLSSPLDISPGKTIFIPNMRGVVIKNKKNLTIQQIAVKYEVGEHYIRKVNKLNHNDGFSYLFVPTGKISTIERSLFLGTGFMIPVRTGRKTSGFGQRRDPFNNTIQFHQGIDIACPRGTKIYSARNGIVSFTGYDGGYGLVVKVHHTHGYYSIYGHLSRILVRKGTPVNTGTIVGLSGNTGRSTGPHLHFEVRKKNRAINPYVLSHH